MAKAAKSSNPRMKRMVALAHTLGKMHHKADGGGIDDSIDISNPGQGPYSLSQAMYGEQPIQPGKRFSSDNIPGKQAARNDAYWKRLKGK